MMALENAVKGSTCQYEFHFRHESFPENRSTRVESGRRSRELWCSRHIRSRAVRVGKQRAEANYSLVVCVAHPRERRGDGNCDSDVGDDTRDEDRVVRVLVVDEDEHDAEDEPREARRCAAAVNASEMLEDRRAAESPPEGRPLRKGRNNSAKIIRHGGSEDADLCEERVDREVEEAAEKLVADEDRRKEIAQDERTRVMSGIRPDVGRSEQDADTVQERHERVEFTIRGYVIQQAVLMRAAE